MTATLFSVKTEFLEVKVEDDIMFVICFSSLRNVMEYFRRNSYSFGFFRLVINVESSIGSVKKVGFKIYIFIK